MLNSKLLATRALSGAFLAISALAISAPAFAQTAGGDSIDDNAPFGTEGSYFGVYQEIISPSTFSSTTLINSIGFASAQDPSLNLYPETATYDMSVTLGYTSAPITTNTYLNPASASFATAIGSTVPFFSGDLTADLTNSNPIGTNTPTFDLVIPGSTPFLYTPTLGENLLLTVNITSASSVNDNTGGTGEQDFFLDGSAPPPTGSGSASEIYYDYVGGPVVTDNDPLLTGFNVGPQATTIPESSPMALVLVGGALIVLTAGLKARRRAIAAN